MTNGHEARRRTAAPTDSPARNHLMRLLTLALVALPTSVHAANEMHAYGVANFGTGYSCSGAKTHSVHNGTPDDFAEVFSEMKSDGKWDDVRVHKNTSVRGINFTDAGKVSGGLDDQDLSGADDADVMFIHTHGKHSESQVASWLSMGNAYYDCKVRTDSNMRWNSDLEIAVVKACQSGDYKVWQDGGYMAQFSTAASQLTMWNAFHGNSACGFWTGSHVSDYAWDSQLDGVGENWLDEFYTEWIGSDNDDCPVSIVMGSDSSARDHQFENGGWRDRKATGTKTGSSYYYIGDCDPEKGVRLPD